LSGGAIAAVGCGGSSKAASPAALRLEREDLIAVSQALQSAEGPVAAEVAATKLAWPGLANGLPADTRRISRPPLRTAAAAAERLRVPALFQETQATSLTGPAAQIAGLFRDFSALASRGWKLIRSSIEEIEGGAPPAASFARANVALYIESIYDAHFSLAQVGRKLLDGYRKLGGPGAFGAALSQAEVDGLAQSYSEASDRLHPHVAVRLGS
jgi:hypothetical protein